MIQKLSYSFNDIILTTTLQILVCFSVSFALLILLTTSIQPTVFLSCSLFSSPPLFLTQRKSEMWVIHGQRHLPYTVIYVLSISSCPLPISSAPLYLPLVLFSFFCCHLRTIAMIFLVQVFVFVCLHFFFVLSECQM